MYWDPSQDDGSDVGPDAYHGSGNRLFVGLLWVTSAALALRLVLLPEPFGTEAGTFALYVVCLAALVEGLMQLLHGFVWQLGASYLRGGVLLTAAAALFVVLG